MPVRRHDEPIEVLLELPGEPRLADASLADDADEARLPLALGGVEQVLEQAQVVVPPDERRLEPHVPALTAAA